MIFSTGVVPQFVNAKLVGQQNSNFTRVELLEIAIVGFITSHLGELYIYIIVLWIFMVDTPTMWVKQCHKPSQSWTVYAIVLPTLLK